MNLLLIIYGYPPAIIRKRDRLVYIASLEKAQLGGAKTDYEKIIASSVNLSLDIYLKATQGKTPDDAIDNDELLKIGELAKAAALTIPTIRYWTKEGLLEVAETTKSGYQLYANDMIDRCRKIQKLKAKRLTIEEIRKYISE